MTTTSELHEKRRKAYGMSERAFAVYVDISCTTEDAVAGALRISVAEELRRLAHGRSMIAPEELVDRATELDPDGATR